MSLVPALPKLEGDHDILLDIYTHRALRTGGDMANEEYGNADRLAELGERVLDLAITSHLFKVTPMLTREQMKENHGEYTSNRVMSEWAHKFNIHKKLVRMPNLNSNYDDEEDFRHFWHAFIGALYHRNGMNATQRWVSQLIDPEVEEPPAPPEQPSPTPSYASSLPSYQQHTPMPGWQPQPPQGPPPQQPPPPSVGPMHIHSMSGPPPLPNYASPPPNPLTHHVTLALFNQTAIQRGYIVSYPAQQQGPPHAPIWTVQCCLNGEERGQGTGRNQKAAKEDAARHAWVSMGWHGKP